LTSDDETIKNFVCWLRKKFPRLHFKVKKSLKDLLPEPKKFKGFWRHPWSHADVSVFRHGNLVCVVEPGGFQHLTDDDQVRRDRKKKSICEESNVYFLPLMNQALENREYKEFVGLLRNAFYSKKGILCLI
jgi:hypothetical protein